MHSILNISAYKFVPLPDASLLREGLQVRAEELGLKGTILLASEGINLFLAGQAAAVRAMLAELREDVRLHDLVPKESWSATQPFRKMLVKVKREIIRMDRPGIQPDFSRTEGRAPAIDAATLRRWLDQGHDDAQRPVVTLDTRNAFEVDHGAFDHAIDWRIERFSDFPQALNANRAALEGKTVVSYCTGGIRCEKAAMLMREVGLQHVYQLDGGILQYFEETDGAHFHGNCFVFDERRTLAADLSTATSAASVLPADQAP